MIPGGAFPDLVIFDVDGTLHDTGRWWPRVLRQALACFAAQLGVAIRMPDDAEACAVIGLRDAAVWSPFLPPEHRERWPELRALTIPLEVEELRSGTDYLFRGTRNLLRRLRELRVRTALASNCRRAYMEAWCDGQGLRALTDWQYCLDSPGIAHKTDMVRAAIAAAGARSPVMVGDREPDLEAAQAAGIPFVWRQSQFCRLEGPPVWNGDPDQLLSLLGLPRIS
jgi:phosphoglycolate phosphatase-like HAD superfamily hydrolase